LPPQTSGQHRQQQQALPMKGSEMSRKHLLAATLLAAPFALPATLSAQPISGLYVGVGAGANFMQQEQARLSLNILPPTVLYGRSSFDTGVAAVGSVGWGFGNGVRVELEGNYRNNSASSGQVFGAVSGREQKAGVMVNALFDLDVGSPYIYPYIGVGAGYAWVNRNVNGGALLPGISVSDSEGGFAYQAIAACRSRFRG